jgi:phospholipase D-like protein
MTGPSPAASIVSSLPTEEPVDFADHPFLHIIWTLFLIFVWIAWLWLMVTIAVDVFRRHDISGFMKAVWIVVLVFLPLIGALIYLISQSHSMAQRELDERERQQESMDAYIRDRAGGGAGDIERAKALLDQGVIDQTEFARLKAKALA